MNILVTGGCGFIGSNFIRSLISKDFNILNIDKLTYAGTLNNLKDLSDNSNYSFIRGDISDANLIKTKLEIFKPNYIINFAAESHVDNSIISSDEFIQSNIIGTFNLLEQTKTYYFNLKEKDKLNFKFHQISTDEVYGDMKSELFHEESHYRPSSPYSASKASADHLVRAWQRTYSLPTIITNCSNNFGPYQYPEKLIPVVIINALNEKKIPVYGNGKQIRDWIYVLDHCDALLKCIQYGKEGETYNIGSSNQITNIELIENICLIMDEMKPSKNYKSYKELIEFVKDRPGHDKKYGINNQKIIKDLNWKPKTNFKKALKSTIEWYLNNESWWIEALKKE